VVADLLTWPRTLKFYSGNTRFSFQLIINKSRNYFAPIQQNHSQPLAGEVRAVNLGPLSQATDIALIQGLFKLEGVETLDLSTTSGTRKKTTTMTLKSCFIVNVFLVRFYIFNK
jgi:hypothetical protein